MAQVNIFVGAVKIFDKFVCFFPNLEALGVLVTCSVMFVLVGTEFVKFHHFRIYGV